MMISCCNDKYVDMVIHEIKKLYFGRTEHRGKVLTYIVKTFNFESTGKVRITMERFIQDLLEDCEGII